MILSKVRALPWIQTVWRRDFSESLLRELHAMASRLMAEDFAHFQLHAQTNDVVHVFRHRGAIVGFQFWRSAPMGLPRTRLIAGGKLRIDPAFRRRGVHLLSGLLFVAQTKARSPLHRHYRMSIASIFGFVSITEALADYRLLGPDAPSAVTEAFRALAAESKFEFDEESGRFFVRIFTTEETLGRYPAEYFERPAAKVYAAANPEFRTNGCYLGFWFRFTPRNLLAIGRAIARRMHG